MNKKDLKRRSLTFLLQQDYIRQLIINYLLQTQFLIGVSFYELSEYKESAYYFEFIYELYKDYASINYMLGRCYLSGKIFSIEKAKKYFSIAQKLGVNLPNEIQEILESK